MQNYGFSPQHLYGVAESMASSLFDINYVEKPDDYQKNNYFSVVIKAVAVVILNRAEAAIHRLRLSLEIVK